jgi:hypothetical protein
MSQLDAVDYQLLPCCRTTPDSDTASWAARSA